MAGAAVDTTTDGDTYKKHVDDVSIDFQPVGNYDEDDDGQIADKSKHDSHNLLAAVSFRVGGGCRSEESVSSSMADLSRSRLYERSDPDMEHAWATVYGAVKRQYEAEHPQPRPSVTRSADRMLVDGDDSLPSSSEPMWPCDSDLFINDRRRKYSGMQLRTPAADEQQVNRMSMPLCQYLQ